MSVGELQTLSQSECRALLAGAEIGRVAVVAPDGPHIIPVNFVVVDESLVFRTGAETLVATYATQGNVALEVDEIDDRKQVGWSVLARGTAAVVVEAEELAHINRVWAPRPWAAGERTCYLRLTYTQLTGRSVSAVESRLMRRL